ncbi:hypothetical protein FRC12_020691 [Ceratobasidium sp. 428]|nr:hypothetical protein FRC12_020691 [Ceratobasidium sp. 428]
MLAECLSRAVVDIGKNGGHVIDVVPSVHADVDIGDKEHHEQPPKNESKPPMNNQKPPQNDQKPPHDDSDIKVDVKADVKDEIKADVHANVKDVVEANVSVNDPK